MVRAESDGTRQVDASVLNPTAQRALLLWFECDHCPPILLDHVVTLGPGVIPYLDAAVVNGPTLSTLLNATRVLRRQYKKLVEYKESHPDSPILPTEHDYVVTHLSHLKIQYQIRAARALGAIGTPTARNSLEKVLQSITSTAVREVINDALKTKKSDVH